MTISLDGHSLTLEDVVRVARKGEQVEVHRDARTRIGKCRKLLDRKIESREIMYGVNTGIGKLAEVVLTPEQAMKFQKYMIYSHAAGCGEPVAEDDVRAGILSRINTHCWGLSGVRLEITTTMAEMLNRGVHPVMCKKGSVGACGDLAPMAQMALVLMGEGDAIFHGKRQSGAMAMKKAGIRPITFRERDGLATINGSNLITGMGCLEVYDSELWIKTQEIAAAMTLEALNANMMAFDKRIHEVRGYPGAMDCAGNIRRICAGSDLLERPGKNIQDAYSLRSTPQVAGAAKDAFKWARYMLETEINHATDNPTFFPDEDLVLTGANFQGTPVALALELTGMSLTTVGVLAERRINRLMNPALNAGLPAFLTRGAGMFSGLIITQYTAGALTAENKVLAAPASIHSVPAAADQEDFVSMGMTTAIKTRQILDNSWYIIAIELMAAAQAFDFRAPVKPSKGCKAAYDAVRKVVRTLDVDRPLHTDINNLAKACRDEAILVAVEKAVGKLS